MNSSHSFHKLPKSNSRHQTSRGLSVFLHQQVAVEVHFTYTVWNVCFFMLFFTFLMTINKIPNQWLCNNGFNVTFKYKSAFTHSMTIGFFVDEKTRHNLSMCWTVINLDAFCIQSLSRNWKCNGNVSLSFPLLSILWFPPRNQWLWKGTFSFLVTYVLSCGWLRAGWRLYLLQTE